MMTDDTAIEDTDGEGTGKAGVDAIVRKLTALATEIRSEPQVLADASARLTSVTLGKVPLPPVEDVAAIKAMLRARHQRDITAERQARAEAGAIAGETEKRIAERLGILDVLQEHHRRVDTLAAKEATP